MLETVVRECEALGGEAIAVAIDVADAGAVKAVAREAIDRFGGIDVWVNCAAVLHFGRLDETPAHVLDRVIATNVLGYLHGAQSALAQFRRQRYGTLINVDSVLGITSQPFAAAYVASKFAIRGFNDAIRQEVRDEPDIHVCIVYPYAVDTPIYQRAANHSGRQVRPVRPRYRASEVANAIVSLARRPRRHAYVGGFAYVAVLSRLLPSPLADRLTRGLVEMGQFGGRCQDSDGNLFEPSTDRWSVSGGWLPAPGPTGMRRAATAGGVMLFALVAALVVQRAAARRQPARPASLRNNPLFLPFIPPSWRERT